MTLNGGKRLRAFEAAEYMRVSRSTLAKWRMRNEGPPYHRCGPRIVYYLDEEIDAWQAQCDGARLTRDGSRG